ncbi:Colicin V secretion protein CvaA [compost metagenome]
MPKIFRTEVAQHAASRLQGNVVLASSLSSKLLAGFAILTIGFAGVFAATASYARKETVVGWLAPEAGLIRLSAREGGILEDILVVEGQQVAAGTPVARIRLSSALENGDSFTALSRSLNTQGEAITERAQTARNVLMAEQRQLSMRRAALVREQAQAEGRLGLQRERVALARAEVERAETIAAQGFLPRRELESRRSAALVIEQEASELATSILTYQREIGEINARLSAIPIDVRAARADTATAAATLDQQRTQFESQSIYLVVAPVAGRIAALPFAEGQAIAPAATVAVFTPGSGPLEAELYAPSRAAGFVREGQKVRLMYEAFPYQKFGGGAGRVESVSRTVLAPSEIAIPGLQMQEPVFRVRVKLDRTSVSAYGQEVPLQPGMLLTADVVIDRRSLLEWLFDPLYAAGRRT